MAAARLDEQELRLGLVMNGGVSLAIWMGGVTRELDHARQSDGVYGELLDLCGFTMRIDVIAGASAGGINGAVLALAIARNGTVAPVRDIWMSDGAIEDLLRDPLEKNALSLLKGDDHLLARLHVAMRKIGSPDPSPATDDDSTQDTRSRQPIHLAITGTTMVGEVKGFTDRYGAPIPDIDHRALFRFIRAETLNRDPLAKPSARNDFARDADDTAAARLALAARSTASFPGAFEPSFVPVLPADAPAPAGPGDPMHPDMRGIADFSTSRWVIDGGVLVNTPFRAALDAIAGLPASKPVRRVLGYVVPDLKEPEVAEPDDRTKPHGAAEVALDALSTIPRVQTVGRELAEIEANNARVRRQRLAREQTLKSFDALSLESTAIQLLDAYVRVRRDSAAEEIVGYLLEGRRAAEGLRATPPDPVQVDAVRRTLANLPDAPWASAVAEPPGPGQLHPLGPLRFGEGWTWGFAPVLHAANVALYLLRRGIDAVGAIRIEGDEESIAARLIGQRTQVHRRLFELRQAEGRAQTFWRHRAGLLDDAEAVPGEAGQWGEAFQGLLATTIAAFADALNAADALLREYTATAPDGDTHAEPVDEVRQMLVTLVGDTATTVRRLLALDIVQRSAGAELRGVEQAVELVLMSADTPTVIDPEGRSTARPKLAGIQISRFGAFYKQSWRANDWMWGRLDGADRLVRTLLDPRRIKARLALPHETVDTVTDRIEAIALGPPGDAHDWLAKKWDREAVRLQLQELADAGPGVEPRPNALPAAHAAIARRVQLEILRDEIPNVRASVREDLRKGGLSLARGAVWDDRLPSDYLTSEQLPAALGSCDIGQEKIEDEIGSDHFTHVATTAGAVAGSVVGRATERVKLLTPVVAWIRGLFLTVYLLGRGVLLSSRTGSFLVAVVLGAGSAIVALALVGVNVPGALTLLGVMLLAAGILLGLIRGLWTRVAAVAAIFVATVAALYGFRIWDDRPESIDALAEVLAVTILVVAPMALGLTKRKS